MNNILTDAIKKEVRYTERISTCSYCFHSFVNESNDALYCNVVGVIGNFKVSDNGSCSKFKKKNDGRGI